MQTIKGGWVGQPFALATYNDSGSRKTRIRRSKEERKTMVETFIKKYQNSNNGNFPSLNLTHKEVGGSFYTVREIVREIIQENKVLGPAKLPPEEQNKARFAEQYPIGSISTEPQSLSLSGETHVLSTLAPYSYMGNSEEADFGANSQLELAEAKVADDKLRTSTSNIDERNEQSDESYIIGSTGIYGFDHGMLKEQMAGDYETTEENEISDKSDLLNDLSPDHQNTNAQVLDSIEIVSEHSNGSLIDGVDGSCPTVDKTNGEAISSESVVRENLDDEGGTNELEASNVRIPLTTEVLVEKFPLRPISKKIDNLDSVLNETVNLPKASSGTEHEQDIITSSEKGSELLLEPVDGMRADPTSENSSELLDEKAELKVGEASLEISSSSEKRAAIADDVVAKASSTLNVTVNASSPMLNKTRDSSSNNGSSNKSAADELIEVKGKTTVQHDSSQQKGGSPPLDRIHLETWKGASSKSKEHETNPLLALVKSFITAFVKFWTEE